MHLSTTVLILLLVTSTANAGVITFEEIVGPGAREFPVSPISVSDGHVEYVFTLVSGNWSIEDSTHAQPRIPLNGTDTMSVDGIRFSVFTIKRSDGGVFDIVSVDLASWLNSGPATTVRVTDTGLSRDFATTTVFATYSFSSAWSGLSSIAFTNVGNASPWSVDNIVVNASTSVPEPTTLALVSLGLAGLVFARQRRRNA